MKKLLLLLLLSCCGLLAAAVPATNYHDAANWVICEADKPETEFDTPPEKKMQGSQERMYRKSGDVYLQGEGGMSPA